MSIRVIDADSIDDEIGENTHVLFDEYFKYLKTSKCQSHATRALSGIHGLVIHEKIFHFDRALVRRFF